MKVLEVVGPSAGGIRQHVATIAPRLVATDHEVQVVAPAGVFDDLLPEVVVAPVGLGRGIPAALRALRPLVASVDVVHAHGLAAGWVSWAAGAGSRLVVTVHNLVLDEAAGRSAPVLRALEGALPGRAQETIVISEQMRARFDPKGTAAHLHVIPPAGPTPEATRSPAEVRAELGIDAGEPLVVLVGRLHPQKDIGTLIDAVPRLAAPAQVVIVGEGPLRQELDEHIATAGVSDRVRLLGASTDAASYMAAADVVVMCSIWEGFGLVVAEALHLGRPVVATAVGPVPSMVSDHVTGRLVPPSDPAALASAIDDLLADPVRAAELGRAGAKLVARHFDADALTAQVAAVYELIPKKAHR